MIDKSIVVVGTTKIEWPDKEALFRGRRFFQLIQHLASGASLSDRFERKTALTLQHEKRFFRRGKGAAVVRGDPKNFGNCKGNDGNGSGKRIDGAPPPRQADRTLRQQDEKGKRSKSKGNDSGEKNVSRIQPLRRLMA